MGCMRHCLKLSTGIHRKSLLMAVLDITKGGEELSPHVPHTEAGNAWISVFQPNPVLRDLETLRRLLTRPTDQE